MFESNFFHYCRIWYDQGMTPMSIWKCKKHKKFKQYLKVYKKVSVFIFIYYFGRHYLPG
jgi:hypothetical protein